MAYHNSILPDLTVRPISDELRKSRDPFALFKEFFMQNCEGIATAMFSTIEENVRVKSEPVVEKANPCSEFCYTYGRASPTIVDEKSGRKRDFEKPRAKQQKLEVVELSAELKETGTEEHDHELEQAFEVVADDPLTPSDVEAAIKDFIKIDPGRREDVFYEVINSISDPDETSSGVNVHSYDGFRRALTLSGKLRRTNHRPCGKGCKIDHASKDEMRFAKKYYRKTLKQLRDNLRLGTLTDALQWIQHHPLEFVQAQLYGDRLLGYVSDTLDVKFPDECVTRLQIMQKLPPWFLMSCPMSTD